MRLIPLIVLVSVLFVSPCYAQKKLLATTGWGSLSGKVTFEGELPKADDLTPVMGKSADNACCLAAPAEQKVNQEWVIDKKTKGVANVFVWIKPPLKTYFPIDDKDKVRKDTVSIDQPFCTYVPHAAAVFPEYYDGTKMVRTGQKFVVKNSSKVPHSVRNQAGGGDNDPFNILIAAGGANPVEMKPYRLPITIDCAFHTWMKTYVMAFDHPYFAVTKEDGTFTIPNVPAGAEVTIMAWHEVVVLNALGIEGKQITLKAGANTFDFTLKVK